MSDNNEVRRAIIDKERLPALFPTNHHTAEFWEHLGRAVATFGFLEEVLGKAIFSFTGTRKFDSEEELQAAYKEWLPKLERALTDQLWNLAESFGKAVRDNCEATIENVDELVASIKEATVIRNVLCHGSWYAPDESGKSLPLFFNKRLEKFDTPMDVAYLQQIRLHVAELACEVINTVTHMGWQFPGGAGPGQVIWSNSSR